VISLSIQQYNVKSTRAGKRKRQGGPSIEEKESFRALRFLDHIKLTLLHVPQVSNAFMHAVIIFAMCGLCLSSLGCMHACFRTPEWAPLDPFQFLNPPGMDCPTS